MITRRNLSVAELDEAIENGEFNNDVVNASQCVAVILTQNWCPQWVFMQSWLKNLDKEAGDLELSVFEAEYNKLPNFNEFRMFKENVFNNWEVPYVRYYKNGKLVGESNFVSIMSFLDIFQNN